MPTSVEYFIVINGSQDPLDAIKLSEKADAFNG